MIGNLKLAAKRAGIVSIAAVLVACASPYGPSGLLGGFKEKQLAPSVWSVVYNGNGHTGQEQVLNYWLYRCAELTIAQGYSYFGALAPKPPEQNPIGPQEVSHPAMFRPGRDSGEIMPTRSSGGYSSRYFYVPGRTITTWHKSGAIMMYHTRAGAVRPEQKFALHAQTVVDRLKPYVESGAKIQAPPRLEVIEEAMRYDLMEPDE